MKLWISRTLIALTISLASTLALPSSSYSATPTVTTATSPGCTGHPRNAAGFVTDGTPQCGIQWCVGPNPGYFACLVGVYPQLPEFLHQLWTASHPTVQAAAAYGPRNGTERCILRVENQGDYGRSGNPSHFGAFQFSPDLWASNGGGNDWGYAPPAEQWQVFYNTVAHDPNYTNWLPYENGQCWLGMG